MRQKLREVRESRKMTQHDIAQRVGINRTTYTNIELGHKNPSLSVAFKIKDALDYAGDDIFAT